MKSASLLYFLWLLFFVKSDADSDYDYDYSSETPDIPLCNADNCPLPDCSCFGQLPKVATDQRPQFVMLTFDDAITVANIETYRNITRGRRDLKFTFFVCHEYNDYTLTNELYRQGHEIAVHSVSHESNTEMWREASEDKWKKEMVGVRTMLGAFGALPQSEIVGHRAPFLQTSGNITFRVLQREKFLYDSSLPSRNYMDPPIWPYTLDHGYPQDCQIEPCPTESFPGLWVVPMIQYKRTSKDGDFFCSMVDACTPQPTTAQDTKDFLLKNFYRHYRTNKAPFPVFLHEAWLKDNHRLDGYLRFIDEIQTMKDVFIVTVRQVVEYMRNPVSYREFRAHAQRAPDKCDAPETCSYKEPLRIMKSCTPCPKYYPWVGTPLGKRPPRDFPNYD